MLKYLIIPLSKDAVSFCQYERINRDDSLIDIAILKKAIVFAMKGNLNIQILYPDYEISEKHKTLIDSIDHTSIVSSRCEDKQSVVSADIIVFDSWEAINDYAFEKDKSYVIRTDKDHFFKNANAIVGILERVDRLIVTITNPQTFSKEDLEKYSQILDSLIPAIRNEYQCGHIVQFNLITDRLFIDKMNNCNAGFESITLAPNGNFYICPAFYLNEEAPIGNVDEGLNIKNPQLYLIDNAPICRGCDAYQCRRCIWLNKKTTGEVNTPSHEQCVMAHVERNASKRLLSSIREIGDFLPGKNICNIDYLDPFEKLLKHKIHE